MVEIHVCTIDTQIRGLRERVSTLSSVLSLLLLSSHVLTWHPLLLQVFAKEPNLIAAARAVSDFPAGNLPEIAFAGELTVDPS